MYNRHYYINMGLINVKLKVSNPSNKRRNSIVEFLVDSGSIYSFVQSKVLKEVGIEPEATKEFVMANGDIVKRKVGIARYHFKGNVGGAPVVFAEDTDENLLGATTLESLGLMLNPFKREIIPITLSV